MLTNPDWATGEVVQNHLGYVGTLFLGIAMLCAVLSGMNAFYLSGSRLMFSMSYADALPQTFGELHPKYGTPDKATYFLMISALICPWFGRQILTLGHRHDLRGRRRGLHLPPAPPATVMARKEGLKAQTIVSGIGSILAAFLHHPVLYPRLPRLPEHPLLHHPGDLDRAGHHLLGQGQGQLPPRPAGRAWMWSTSSCPR